MYTGSRAEQVISGAAIMVAIRSLADGSVRVAMIPGTAQANEDSIATNARPSSPVRRHHPVHQERGAGQVADALQQRDQHEQQQRSAAGTPARRRRRRCSPFATKAGERGVRTSRRRARPSRSKTGLDAALERRRDGEDHLEEGEHGREEDQRCPRPGAAARRRCARVRGSGPAAGTRPRSSTDSAQASRARRRRWAAGRAGRPRRRVRSSSSRSRVDAVAVEPTTPTTGTPSAAASAVEVDVAAAARQLVGQGQHDRHRWPEREHLGEEPERALEAWSRRRRRASASGAATRSGARPRSTSDDDLLVGADRVEAVGARQVLDARRRRAGRRSPGTLRRRSPRGSCRSWRAAR